METAVIYMYQNKINGKAYIGQTWHPRSRKSGHKGVGSGCKALKSAFHKYGFDSFSLTYLIDGIVDQDILDSSEEYMIWFHKTLSPNGYNLRSGGSGGRFSEELREVHRKAVSEATKKDSWIANNLRCTRETTSRPEWRESNLQAARRRANDPKVILAYRLAAMKRMSNDAYKATCSDRMRGFFTDKDIRDRWLSAMRKATCKKVICNETGIIYSSVTEAAESMGVGRSTISMVLSGKAKRMRNGMTFSYV